ncbi:Rpn family recombination-promoting nuclease/putative transposase [Thauera aromatica]|uniref:Putative transposase n=1 Tax=Thauera aromatica K172 TaxID=44139 RepID=A0A2R4BJ57_THAAR|nr:Rpn family recombination-promoting nuclease/putative transposase [Thauera aromatica]AVR87329.1 putative transposase [Thauera aromatica K172]
MPARDHDSGYKLLFSDPLMVRDLVRGFVDDPWLQRLDFSTLEPVKGHYVSEDMRQRADDVVWRVKSGEGWVYLYLLIEFQHAIDRFMALRMLVYVGLLYQDLIRQKQLAPGGQLPPVLPIVLYNGERRWRAPTTLAALLPPLPAFLKPLQPQMRYVLIDEGAYPDETLRGLPQNLAAAIFQAERLQTPAAIQDFVARLEAETRAPAFARVRRIVAIWLRAVLRHNRTYAIDLPELDDLQELNTMLSQRIEKWAKEYLAAGEQKGRVEGLQQGVLRGEARVLARILTRRFGELPGWAEAHLSAATEAQLEAWSDAVLDARSLAEVFAEPQGRPGGAPLPASH